MCGGRVNENNSWSYILSTFQPNFYGAFFEFEKVLICALFEEGGG